jgi:hypothetical protein
VQGEVEGALVGESSRSDPWFFAAASNGGAQRSTRVEARIDVRWRRAALNNDGWLASRLRDGRRAVVRWPR